MDGKYLLKRGRTWYVRFAIPHTVQDIFGKQEFVQSLKTKDFQEAKLLKHKYLDRIDGDLTLLISWKDRMFPNSPEIEYIGRTLDEGSSISQKFADLLLTTESLVLTGNELLEKCGLKPNMIAKALESRLVKPILQNRSWKRVRNMEYLGYGRGYIIFRD